MYTTQITLQNQMDIVINYYGCMIGGLLHLILPFAMKIYPHVLIKSALLLLIKTLLYLVQFQEKLNTAIKMNYLAAEAYHK